MAESNHKSDFSRIRTSEETKESMLYDFNKLQDLEDPIPSNNSSAKKKIISPKFGADDSPSKQSSSVPNQF